MTPRKPDGYKNKSWIRNAAGQIVDSRGANNTKYRHGLTNSKEYRAWKNMIHRCYSPKHTSFHNYGGRGINVCVAWRTSPEQFLADVGAAPNAAATLGRIDNNGNYEPSNCRWETKRQNDNNKRTSRLITFNGQTLTITEWAHQLRINPSTLYFRIKRGIPLSKALTSNSFLGNNQHDKK